MLRTAQITPWIRCRPSANLAVLHATEIVFLQPWRLSLDPKGTPRTQPACIRVCGPGSTGPCSSLRRN
eukprot:scaffold121445_cov63-Phaeocystis_antarctica.AAC.3